jgi:hypothetical protein
MVNENGEDGGMRELVGETEVPGENLPQIPHELTWDRSPVTSVGSWQLTI